MPGQDINQYINKEWDVNRDPEGHLEELDPWSKERALDVAQEQGIEMTDSHWDVVNFLRDRYVREGQAKSGRIVVEALEQQYADKGGKRYLYTLFPHGPVTQGSKIAGLPLPAYTTDPSFGSSE